MKKGKIIVIEGEWLVLKYVLQKRIIKEYVIRGKIKIYKRE